MLGSPSGGHWPKMCVVISPVPRVEPSSWSPTVYAVMMGNVVAGNDQTWCSIRGTDPIGVTTLNVMATFIEKALGALAPEQNPRPSVWASPVRLASVTPRGDPSGFSQVAAPLMAQR